jgi:hypothetical protein
MAQSTPSWSTNETRINVGSLKTGTGLRNKRTSTAEDGILFQNPRLRRDRMQDHGGEESNTQRCKNQLKN